MNNLETRKAQLREYIWDREKATNGKWVLQASPDCSPGSSCRSIWVNGIKLKSCIYEPDARFIAKAANESALIAEQLLECIEALGMVDSVGIPEPYSNIIKQALNKIAGEK